jgi:protein-S-isoprenylcysteine O-methyltransferase Ste14
MATPADEAPRPPLQGTPGQEETARLRVQPKDNANTVVRPPIAWALSIILGLAAGWTYPLPFLPASVPAVWAGSAVFALAFAWAAWALATMRRAGTRVETYKPTERIVAAGPYRFSRNPIYSGMLLGQLGLAVGFDSLWLLATLVPFYLVIRHGVVAREEAYLERKFGSVYLDYKSRVRRWI